MPVTLQRLKRRREFLRIASAGKKWVAPGLIVQLGKPQTDTEAPANGHSASDRLSGDKRPRDGQSAENIDFSTIRIGFTVSRKVGNAVARNRARRRLRAAAECVMRQYAIAGHDFVVIGRKNTLKRPFHQLIDDMKTALKKLNVYHDPQTGEA